MIQKEKIRGVGYFLMALATGLLPFAAPDACAQALREGLALCGGPLLLSLFPFLIVSTLLIQCPAADVLGLPFCPVARLIGVRAPAAGRVLLIGSLGGFAPAASAVAGAVRSGQLTAREADALLPACVCSGPSFVILAVGQSMLGSAELGVLLFLAQVAAGYLSAALLARLGGTLGSMAHPRCPDRFAASPAGRHHRAGVPDLPQALRFRPVFPDAGRRSGGSTALRCRRFMRDAFRGLLWL